MELFDATTTYPPTTSSVPPPPTSTASTGADVGFPVAATGGLLAASVVVAAVLRVASVRARKFRAGV
jgi:hypothetical protein